MITGINGGSYRTPDLGSLRQNRFKKADQDGDGKITKDELSAAIPKNGKGPGVDDIFNKVDTNQDGSIDEAEDKAAFEQMRKNGPPGGPHGPGGAGGQPDASKLAEALFKKADGDSDGKISQDELTKVFADSGEDTDVSGLFKAADSDEDGSISQAELEELLKKALEQAQSNRSQAGASGGYDKAGGAKDSSTQSQFSAVA
jgi:Ca2+-binding EF-hand superfamily protein